MTITRILVPTDFSRDADTAMLYAIDLAKPFGAIVELLHVVEDPLAAGMWSAEYLHRRDRRAANQSRQETPKRGSAASSRMRRRQSG